VYKPKKHTLKVSEMLLNAVISLKHVIQWIDSLHTALNGVSSPILQAIQKVLPSFLGSGFPLLT
jgi:hypothetical protein